MHDIFRENVPVCMHVTFEMCIQHEFMPINILHSGRDAIKGNISIFNRSIWMNTLGKVRASARKPCTKLRDVVAKMVGILTNLYMYGVFVCVCVCVCMCVWARACTHAQIQTGFGVRV